MRRVVNQTSGRMIVEWMPRKPFKFQTNNLWETIANLSPGMIWESHPDYFGPIRVSCYDDRDVKERDEISFHGMGTDPLPAGSI